MTRDEVIQMAVDAGFKWPEIYTTTPEERLERFAALVAKAEREAILKKADSLGWVSVDDIRARGDV